MLSGGRRAVLLHYKSVPPSYASMAKDFSTIDKFQKGENPAFDAFVATKRQERDFERFDQRVERAYTKALAAHKAEIWNGVKRRLKRTGDKYNAAVLTETNRALEDRTQWLRDVFAQIDADYRSKDENRQASAAADITKALRGEPFDCRATASERRSAPSSFTPNGYERNLDRRFKGPKGQMAMDAEADDDVMPDITEDEANRYMNLRPKMAHIEAAVRERYGLVGAQHWESLQAIKDAEYVDKLERAATKYQELLDQSAAYEESTDSLASRRLIGRIHEGQVRFQTAMELEEERLKLVEARQEMDNERYQDQKLRRRRALERAADWRDEGVPEAEIAQRLKAETFERVVAEYAEVGKKRKSEVLDKKRAYMTLVEEMESRFEANDGARSMAASSPGGSLNEAAQQEMDSILAEARKLADDRALAAEQEKETAAAKAQGREPRPMAKASHSPDLASQKRALWDVVNEDTYNDPFLVVHQARMDARKTYTDLYAHTHPWSLRLGRTKNQGDSSRVGGGMGSRHVLKDASEYRQLGWGVSKQFIHDFDDDPANQYVVGQEGYHRKDPETGNIDMFYERKAGRGMRWTGQRFYKLGIDEDRAKADTKSEWPAGYGNASQRSRIMQAAGIQAPEAAPTG
jgi:hypothetical protein